MYSDSNCVGCTHIPVYEVTELTGESKIWVPERCFFGDCLSPKMTSTYALMNGHMGSVLNCKLLRYFSTYVDDNEVMGCDLSQLTPEERETVPIADAGEAYSWMMQCTAASFLLSERESTYWHSRQNYEARI